MLTLPQKRQLVVSFALFAGTVALLAMSAQADSIATSPSRVPHSFAPNEPIIAAKMNANFTAVDAALNDAAFPLVARAHGQGPVVELDAGVVTERQLTYGKQRSDTTLRVQWVDTFWAEHSECSYEFKFNGESCGDPGPLVYTYPHGGQWSTNSMFGACSGLSPGQYVVRVEVLPGGGDCKVGGRSSSTVADPYWAFEVSEVR